MDLHTKNSLTHHLMLASHSGELNFNEFDHELIPRVVRGISHCESHGIEWKRSVLSPQHLAHGDTLAYVMAKPKNENRNKEYIQSLLSIPLDADPLDYGLPIEHPSFTMDARKRREMLLFLWVQAHAFLLAKKYEDRIGDKLSLHAFLEHS